MDGTFSRYLRKGQGEGQGGRGAAEVVLGSGLAPGVLAHARARSPRAACAARAHPLA